jgi:hypothetical protein
MKFLLALALLPSFASAAPPKCANKSLPRLTADPFAPVECSTATYPPPASTIPAAHPMTDPKRADLKEFVGSWEGDAQQGFGRYKLRIDLKAGWFGRLEADVHPFEVQQGLETRQTVNISRGKGTGRYDLTLSAQVFPGATLKGEALLGTADLSTGTVAERQLDLSFANGTVYRARFRPEGPDALRVRVWWALPGVAERYLETLMHRVSPKKP